MNILKSVEEISLDEALPLRSSVLCNGAPLDQCTFIQDGRVEGLHYGLKENEAIIAIVSCYKRPLEPSRLPGDLLGLALQEACQFRGMAVHQPLQKCGYGKTLWQAAEKMMAEKWAPEYCWFYSLPVARGFYEKLGYTAIDEFEMVDVGPLVTMYRKIAY